MRIKKRFNVFYAVFLNVFFKKPINLKKQNTMINKIHNENCLETMAKMKDNFIDLTVTSPPYDNLREYNGYSFDFESVAKELYRTTKEGGVDYLVETSEIYPELEGFHRWLLAEVMPKVSGLKQGVQ